MVDVVLDFNEDVLEKPSLRFVDDDEANAYNL
jgi:hypothetical protein